MTTYLLSVHGRHGDAEPPAEEIQEAYAAVDAFNKEVMDSGAWVFAGGLYPIESATVVDATKGETITTDGPFAETKEFLGGFWVLTADDLDAALALAARASKACRAPVEVRPFQDDV